MCGITGLITSAAQADVAALIERMTNEVRHRGPDAGATVVRPVRSGGAAALGHRRLSIIDLSPLGNQPMQSPSGRDIWVAFNGEIYNFLELRPELEKLGFRFRSSSDTEVLVAAYEAWGAACVERIEGMFAFGIWDGEREQLLLARDRLGKKPLAYWHDGRTLAFASELPALTCLPSVSRALDSQSLAAYFSLGFVPGERSIFAEIRKIPPGHRGLWRDGRLTVERYWNPIDALSRPTRTGASDEQLLDELDGLLGRAVRQRLISDVPLGAWLSGGVDSTLVVAEMCAAGGRTARTFTIGFDDERLNEAEHARALAKHLGTQHEEFRITAAEMVAAVPEAAAVYDEPFADEAGIPTYVLSKMTRRHVTVALCGDGGDEGFMGYSHYRRGRMLAWIDALPRPLRRAISAVGLGLGGGPLRRRLHSFAYEDWADLYVKMTSTLRQDALGRVIDVPFLLDGTIYRDVARQLGRREPETMLALFDTMTTLPDKFLVKVDRASMRAPIEVRAPFLDHHLVEWALALPRSAKLRNGTTKHLLRELLYRKVPRALVDRPKQGFCPPMDRWLRVELADWVRDVLAPERLRATGVLNEGVVSRIVQAHQSGTADVGAALWTLICFMVWYDHAGRAAPARPTTNAVQAVPTS